MSEMNLLSNLLDSTIDDLADLEKFEPLPAGSHQGTISWSEADDEEKLIVVMKYTHKETLELAKSTDQEPEPGKVVNFRFPICMRDGSPILISRGPNQGKPMLMGQGQLKEICAILKESFGGETLAEVMNNSEGAEVALTVKVRASKDDPDMKNNDIKTLSVV